ncbi:uncharacterized protein [Spinacia oleracea]|uniref:SWIM-type domain-containing protein n=1 Tax=Spinacia oleracea TaxID=3562 RepID=A0A9R0IUT1_SPIOL|nr:uncharacterized protein LOC110794242 [Spinacia oleracea]
MLPQTDYLQIRTMNLRHTCVRTTVRKCVKSDYLCERYLETWRSDPHWKLKKFMERVMLELGVKITYSTAWLARARAKLALYGSSAEQYGRVWEYAKAFLTHNPGSSCLVLVDSNFGPEKPLFLRMYCCLEPLMNGFRNGCRPIVGLDGCHLKGAYPGQILVAVGKDENNNIFPIAWATVEIENTETWCWFIDLFMKDFDGGSNGVGLTFMSDRQKGLLEAIKTVTPQANNRFCVRHIWANFKLNFTRTLFKDLFWDAARATTFMDFEIAMESIRFLDEDAWSYLDDIQPTHWSRWAFLTDVKSNMLLNNLCETFNAVIKDARDKPILTQMEWMRRYMMKMNNDKWEAAKKMKGRKLMPYIGTVFDGLEKYSRGCIVKQSRDDQYEVELGSDQVTIDLANRTCSCFHWDLTGIPCVHAYSCIMDKRANPDDYVHEYYSMRST